MQHSEPQILPETPLRADRTRALPRLVARAPWWVLLLVGLACVVFGALIILRPLSSLATLGVYVGLSFIVSGLADLLTAGRDATPRLTRLLGSAWIAAGLIVLVWLGLAIDVLPVFLAVVLIATGVVSTAGVMRGSADQRAAALLFGLADIAFGVLALFWPDVTLLVVAVLFGARTVIFGTATIWSAVLIWFGERPADDAGATPSLLRRWARLGGAIGAVILALGASALTWTIQPGAAHSDAFYTAPGELSGEPGELLRVEPFERGIPDSAVAWRILYTTTTDTGAPTLASGIVLTSATGTDAPRDAIAWAHGTTGYATHCAPSLLADPIGAGALPALEQILDAGWSLIATDYAGLGTAGAQPYLVGGGEGRSVLDSVRAASQMEEIALSGRTTIWGHSQGGHASLWAGQLAESYAPELDIAGVAALAPASDTIGLVNHLPSVTGGSVFASFVAEAYFAHYPDVTRVEYLEPSARTLVREMSTRCLSAPGVLVSVLAALSIDQDMSIFRSDPTQGALGERLRANTPRGDIRSPLFVGQGGADPLVDPAMQRAYLAERCASGQELEYREYAGLDHMGIVGPGSPLIGDLLSWTQDRFSGEPATPNCAEAEAAR
ncbi:lipase family protein [Microterricola pindariensis]|uniref:lipase family protein n=1 Tax=Microterricola pindariensis TaxID=478010 RepID=UPI0019310582|nr:lipase family protein [Microterricola pindariensis]